MVARIHVIGNVQLDVLASPVTALPPPGTDSLVDRIDVRPAGAAGNVSLALVALGVPHRLFSAVGNDYAGHWVRTELDRLGVGSDVRLVNGEKTSISIAVESAHRDRAFMTAHGVLNAWGPDCISADASDADLLLLTGYFSLPALRGTPTRELLVDARQAGATTLFDTGWDPDAWATTGRKEVLDLLPLVDVFLPNEPEALALTGESDPLLAGRALARISGGTVIVKLGASGATMIRGEGAPVHIAAPPAVPIDTTGAGDSLAAGLLADLCVGADVEDALRLGVAVASAVVARPSHDRYPAPH